MSDLLRHIGACNNAVLPGGRAVFRVDGVAAGWLDPALAGHLPSTDIPAGSLQTEARRLADAGLFRWRHEAFDVRAAPDGPVLAVLDRGALPGFGVQAVGVHLNGLVRRGAETLLWVARRAQDKLLDPGKLDHLVAGGVSAGMTAFGTLVKEAEEEAAVPESLVRQAHHVATISYAMQRPEGLRRDRLHCYDLEVPESFVPHATDGEVEAFELWPIARVLEQVRRTDSFKFNVNLVLIDLFLRHAMLGPREAATLRAALDAASAYSGAAAVIGMSRGSPAG